MLKSLFVWLSLSSAGASRIQTESQSDIGPRVTCDDLQSAFHNQVHSFRVTLDARTSESAVTQARFAMRMSGIVRTLRRAHACDWVVENNSDDIEDMRGIMQEWIAGNPCGEAARSEFEAGIAAEGMGLLAAEDQMQVIVRAMSTLMSDDCEAPEIQPADDAQTPEAHLQEVEEDMQDTIDELMDAEEEGDSFIQLAQAGRFQRFMRGVGVFFLMLFLLLACVGSAAIIAGFLGFGLGATVGLLLDWGSGLGAVYAIMGVGLIGAGLGATVGLVGCAHQLYNTLLPSLDAPSVGTRRRLF